MRLYTAFILFLLATNSYAKEEMILFKAEGFFYTLNTSTEAFKIKGYMIDLSFKKKPCNENLILSLHKKITDAMKKIITTDEKFYFVELNSKKYQISKKSDFGKLLYSLPNIIKANKKKESFLCRSIKK